MGIGNRDEVFRLCLGVIAQRLDLFYGQERKGFLQEIAMFCMQAFGVGV